LGIQIPFFFFNAKRKGIYLGSCIKYRITTNISWIPAFAGMKKKGGEVVMIRNKIR